MGKIILPNTELVNPHIGLHMAAAGKYRCEIRKARTGKLKYDTGWFDNLITDRGLIEWWNLPHLGSFDWGELGASCAVGTGSTTPSFSDVQLANYRAAAGGTGSTGGGSGFPQPNASGYVAASPPTPAYWYARYIYQFGTGAAAGNLTEVGVYPGGASASADLFSRALILDDSGNPTAITVLSDEILTVTWELRWYLDTTDHSFTFNMNGSPITGTYRLWNGSSQKANTESVNGSAGAIAVYSGDIVPALSGTPTGSLGSAGLPTFVQFVNDLSNSGTCYYDIKGTMPTTTGTGTIKSFTYTQHMWSYQFGNLSTPIIKTAGQQMQVNFRGSWGRYTP